MTLECGGSLDMIEHDRIRQKLQFMRNKLRQLEQVQSMTFEDFETHVKMVRFRNRIVHMYDDVDSQAVYRLITHNLDDFRDFMSTIVARYFT